MFVFRCPQCHGKLTAAVVNVGRRGKCPLCSALFAVPVADTQSPVQDAPDFAAQGEPREDLPEPDVTQGERTEPEINRQADLAVHAQTGATAGTAGLPASSDGDGLAAGLERAASYPDEPGSAASRPRSLRLVFTFVVILAVAAAAAFMYVRRTRQRDDILVSDPRAQAHDDADELETAQDSAPPPTTEAGVIPDASGPTAEQEPASPPPPDKEMTARDDTESSALQAIVRIANPSNEKLQKSRFFLTSYPSSQHRGAVLRRQVDDMGRLFHTTDFGPQAGVISAYRDALTETEGELLLLAADNAAFWKRLTAVVQATCRMMRTDAAVLEPREVWSDFAVQFGMQLVEQRAADDVDACRLCLNLVDAVPKHARREALLVTTLARTQAVLATPSREARALTDTLLSHIQTAAAELLDYTGPEGKHNTAVHAAAGALAARGQVAPALALTEGLLANAAEGALSDRVRRQRRIWDPAIAERDRQALEQAVAQKVEALLPETLQIDEQAVAEHLEIGWPVPPPALSEANIDKAVAAKIERELAWRFPVSTVAEIRSRSAEIYKAYKVGDTVTLRLKVGQKRYGTVSGRITKVYPNHVRIGDRYIPKVDLLEEDLVRLDTTLCGEMRATYIRRHTDAFTEQREKFEREAAQTLSEILYPKAGYTRVDGTWEAKDAVLQRELVKQKKARTAELSDRVEREVFEQAGFERRNGQWHPSSEE